MIKNLFSMTGKVCVVTGGSSGLGSYMAQGFLESGAARVYITARSEDKLVAKAEELSQVADGQCIAVPGDLSDMKGVEALSASIRNAEEYVDVLVNNAGIGTGAYIDDLKVEDWDRTLDLNLRSPLFLTQSLLGLLRKRATLETPSSVIFISTVAASEVFPHVMAYSTSKKGLEHLTPQLALALADDHIRVNAIAPGRFYSEMTRGAWQNPESEAFKAELERLPAHRYGGPEDIAGVAIMLCSRAGAYFTGEVLNLDGGHRVRR
ncbi:MAG: 3-oxoacyl-ACP reductase [Gammaproteobacteria bacterium]|jgi:NAD(P)-dependent dehydrogenase (short-subunit alcohol dehydrogenase family)|nr:3-oxoacyl-ACP reductase [Gammaproteobacteria bacterium]|tara:strand:+ start:2456 stop:3247 length:792 start_codon:yes stop_codon:yes gene_type:complete